MYSITDIDLIPGARIDKIEDADDDTNDVNINEITTSKSAKREIDIWLVLVVVIVGKRSTKDV